MDTDEAILTALLNDKWSYTSHYEQMKLTILWNRADLAESSILSTNKWEPRESTLLKFEEEADGKKSSTWSEEE